MKPILNANEMELAKARQVVCILAGLEARDAFEILGLAKSMIGSEILSTVLNPEFRTEDEKRIAPFLNAAAAAQKI